MKNVWQKIAEKKKKAKTPLGRKIFTLAPMINVTDTAFRQIIAKHSRHNKPGGGPDLFWTEFVSADGLASEAGRKATLRLLQFNKRKESPVIAQVFGANPEAMEKACTIISKLGFAGIDINMGCPDKDVVKNGAGVALIKNPKLAREIIRAAIRGAGKLPVSVKTRIGFNQIEYATWLPELLAENIAALSVHLRTKKEMSLVPAHWELAKDIAKTVRAVRPDIILLGNGDVHDLRDGEMKVRGTGFDGVMIGRGVFGNPWLFDAKRTKAPSVKEKLSALLEHVKLFEKQVQHRNFAIMKKHFKAYVSGFLGAKELRIELMEAPNANAVKTVLSRFIKTLAKDSNI